MESSSHSSADARFQHAGETGALMASIDWSQTSLGAVETWPATLRAMVELVLRNGLPMMLWWGPRLVQIYNDPFRPLLGEQHPRSLGEPADAAWGEHWSRLEPAARVVLEGGPATRSEALWLSVEHEGRRSMACFTFCFGPVLAADGRVGGVLVSVEKVMVSDQVREAAAQAERERTQRIVQDAETRLHLVLDAASLGTWDFDPITGHLQADMRFRTLFGLSAEAQLDFTAILACIHPEDRERASEATRRMMDPENPEPLVIEYRTIGLEDGVERWVHARGKMLVDPHSGAVRCVGIVRDNAADKALELEREARMDALSRTVRFAELFVGVLGHDLRTPLNTIKLGAELLAMREHEVAVMPPSSDTLVRARGDRSAPTQRILKSVDRMRRMIDDLLDFTHARLGRGLPLAPREANLLEIAQGCIDELQTEEPAIEVQSKGDPRGRWDPDRLAQLLTNLLANALEHGSQGSPIKVRIDGREAEGVELEVHNEGSIEPAMLPVIFDPFATGRRKRGHRTGLGLGLYITQQIAVGHGGTISAQSEPGEGTTLRVLLPRQAAVPAPA